MIAPGREHQQHRAEDGGGHEHDDDGHGARQVAHGGDAEAGIRGLRTAAEEGRFFRVESALMLAYIHTTDDDNDLCTDAADSDCGGWETEDATYVCRSTSSAIWAESRPGISLPGGMRWALWVSVESCRYVSPSNPRVDTVAQVPCGMAIA